MAVQHPSCSSTTVSPCEFRGANRGAANAGSGPVLRSWFYPVQKRDRVASPDPARTQP